MKTDCLVLGAGMVGVSAALHLQAKGRAVVLVDRRPASEETSYGNAGLIHREGVLPYAFPRDLRKILTYALNRSPEANLHWRAIPWLIPFVYEYWRNGTPERIAATAAGLRPLVERCIDEHATLMADAGISAMMRRTGYIKIFRSDEHFNHELETDIAARRTYGVTAEPKTPDEVRDLEPHLTGPMAGGILMPQAVSVADPGAVGKAYADLFVRRGGKFITADARTLERVAVGPLSHMWRLQRVEGAITAPVVVVALGPWTGEIVRPLGVTLPLAVKRGYHMHYGSRGNATLSRPVVDADNGYLLTPMTQGIRLTTGAEFALHDAPATPVQLEKVEPLARALYPLADRVDATPWLGSRPCFPDLLPMMGEAPGLKGLWLDCGHHHLGFTLGPVTGRLLAQLITGETPFIDPKPYRAVRFS
jgi:D-amino-acid dehydrogenase